MLHSSKTAVLLATVLCLAGAGALTFQTASPVSIVDLMKGPHPHAPGGVHAPLGASMTLTCQEVPAGNGGSECAPPPRVCSPSGQAPDLSYKNSAAYLDSLGKGLQHQCSSFEQDPGFLLAACKQTCPERSGLCFTQLKSFSCNYTRDDFCAPYALRVQDGGVRCESDWDCQRGALQCYDTCRDCFSENECDGRVFNRTIAPWATRDCNSHSLYKKPSELSTCSDCTLDFYSYCPATASCFNSINDCNAVCSAKGAGPCVTQVSQCPKNQSPCTQCHLNNKAWCQTYGVCFDSQSDCTDNCKECFLPSQSCPSNATLF